MAWHPNLTLTPRLVVILQDEERRATERGDGYLGTEHLLEAILSDPSGVAAQILERLGVVDLVRAELDGVWSSPADGSLLMADSRPDAAGDPYQVALTSTGPGAPMHVDLDDEGHPQVRTSDGGGSGSQAAVVPAPDDIGEAALRWQEEQDQLQE
jgi:hypothetical protein